MAEPIRANAPKTADGKEYHTHTGPGDIASACLLPGSPDRAVMIATNYFENAVKVGDHRGLKSFTGVVRRSKFFGNDPTRLEDQLLPISVVTTGMGGASAGIVLPEAKRCGAKVFTRIGSASVLQPKPKLRESMICTGAARFDGASPNWAPIQFPAVADWRVVAAFVESAKRQELPYHVGIGATTDCFNEGQARPDDSGFVPPHLLAQHEWLTQCGTAFYSMEEAALFIWCLVHGGMPAGAVEAIYGNRATNGWDPGGEEEATRIAIGSMFLLHDNYPELF